MESMRAQSLLETGTERTTPKALAEAGVRAVALVFVDNAGVARMKCVTTDRLGNAAEHGIGISVVFGGACVDDHFAAVPGIDGPTGDLRLVADLQATRMLHCSPGWAWAPVDQRAQEGKSWPGCQREFLRRMIARAADFDLDVVAAFELEWTLGREGPDGLEPIHAGPGYGAATFPALSDYLLELIDALQGAGVGVEQIHPEYARGQVEISLSPRDPVGACDEAVFCRHVARTLAERRGLRASFSPVVFAGAVANGCHTHFSLWRDGENQFSGGNGPAGLRESGEAFLAGVLEQMAALTALGAPAAVSYLRLQPSQWAGAYACWGHENREAALRLESAVGAAAERSANVEWKSVDMAANPYLVLGGVLAAGLDGVGRRLPLPAPVAVDPVTLTGRERKANSIRRLPESLAEAAEAFAASAVLRDAMGGFLHDCVAYVRREEAAAAAGIDPETLVERHRWRY
jgi:glutamine synthetase